MLPGGIKRLLTEIREPSQVPDALVRVQGEARWGSTSEGIEEARRMLRRRRAQRLVSVIGANILGDELVRFEFATPLHPAPSFSFVEYLSGFCWGYSGTGPHGLVTVLRSMLRLPAQLVSQVAHGAPRTVLPAVNWVLAREWPSEWTRAL